MWLTKLFTLLRQIPDIIKSIVTIIQVVEHLFPSATGPQKLAAAAAQIAEVVPKVTDVLSSPELDSVISGVVGIANMAGGIFNPTDSSPAP